MPKGVAGRCCYQRFRFNSLVDSPFGVAAVTFDRSGTYAYICKEHPWAYAQIIVE